MSFNSNVFGNSSLNGAVGLRSTNPLAPSEVAMTRVRQVLPVKTDPPRTLRTRLQRSLADPVEFDLQNALSGLGIRMSDIARKADGIARYMRDPYKLVYEGTDVRAINLFIVWPAYPLTKFLRAIDPFAPPRPGYKRRARITRLELALMIVKHYLEFYEMMAKSKSIVPAKQSSWTLGEQGLAFDDLFLVRLENTQGNVFQAVVQIMK